MNLVGKIFIVMILVMSLGFMAMAMAVYANHRNYQALFEKTGKELSEVKVLNDQLTSEVKVLNDQLNADRDPYVPRQVPRGGRHAHEVEMQVLEEYRE